MNRLQNVRRGTGSRDAGVNRQTSRFGKNQRTTKSADNEAQLNHYGRNERQTLKLTQHTVVDASLLSGEVAGVVNMVQALRAYGL